MIQPTRRSEEFNLVLSLLTHQWMSADDVIMEAMKKMPPGKCIRRYDERISKLREKKDVQNPRPVSDERKKYYGARDILNAVIGSMKESGDILVDKINGTRSLRLNRFNAADLDRLLAAQSAASPSFPPPAPPPLDIVFQFDHNTVEEHFEIESTSQGVRIRVTKILPSALTLNLSRVAADWISDQIARASIDSRSVLDQKGKETRSVGDTEAKIRDLMKPTYRTFSNLDI
jgi:hypothetical protein